jgi:hypothetical protein
MKLVNLLIEMSKEGKEEEEVSEALTLNQNAVANLIPRMKNVSEKKRFSDLSSLIDILNDFYAQKGYKIKIKNR